MKKFLNNLKEESSHIRMSHAEKTAMRAEIFGVSGVEMPQKSPYLFDSFFTYNTRMVMAGLLLFVLLGSGTVSAAAQNALPGDLLYPVKVSINERAEVALAPTSADKAAVQAQLAERRVTEAQTLASQGRLTAQTADTLSADFDAHAAQALALAGPDDSVQPLGVSAGATVQATPVSVPAPTPAETPKADAPVRTMIMRSAVTMSAEDATTTVTMHVQDATSTAEAKTPFIKKSEGVRGALRASLEIQGDLLRALKVRAQQEDVATSSIEIQ